MSPAKRLNRSRCRLGCGLELALETMYKNEGPGPLIGRDNFEGEGRPCIVKCIWTIRSLCGGDAAFCQIRLPPVFLLLSLWYHCMVKAKFHYAIQLASWSQTSLRAGRRPARELNSVMEFGFTDQCRDPDRAIRASSVAVQ